MGDLDDLIERIRRRPVVARYRDVERLLVAYGWEKREPMRKHWLFAKEGELLIEMPTVKGRDVKGRYLDMICDRVGVDGLSTGPTTNGR